MASTSLNLIASRYAEALFDLAGEQNATDAVERDLLALSQAADEQADFKRFLESPVLTKQAKTQAMQAVLEKGKAHTLTQKIVVQLAEARRLAILPALSREFAMLAAKARGELHAEAITLAPLKNDEKQAIVNALSGKFGRKVLLENTLDPHLLGGMRLKIGDKVIDYSVSGQLKRLERILKQPAAVAA